MNKGGFAMSWLFTICLFGFSGVVTFKYYKVEKELKEAKKEIERLKMKAIRKDSL